MPTWFLLLQTFWLIGFLVLGLKTWLLQWEIFENLAPGAGRWKFFLLKMMPVPEDLNETGRTGLRLFYRWLCVFLGYFIGGGLLFQALK